MVYSAGANFNTQRQTGQFQINARFQSKIEHTLFTWCRPLRRRRLCVSRELSKPRRQRHRGRRKTTGLMSRAIAMHVRYTFLYISSPFSAKQHREMTKFCVFWKTQATMANILNFLMELIAGITYLIWAGFQKDFRSERVQLLTKLESKISNPFFARRRPWRHRCQCLSSLIPYSKLRQNLIIFTELENCIVIGLCDLLQQAECDAWQENWERSILEVCLRMHIRQGKC